MSCVRFASDVEILFGILWELFEKECEKSVDVFRGSDSVGDAVGRIRKPDVNGLVEEDYIGVAVPAIVIVNHVSLLVNAGWAKFQEETGQGRASRAAVEPQYNRVVCGIVARLEEPCKLAISNFWGETRCIETSLQ